MSIVEFEYSSSSGSISEEYKVLRIMQGVFALLSMIGTIFMIVSIIFLKRYTKPHGRFLLYLGMQNDTLCVQSILYYSYLSTYIIFCVYVLFWAYNMGLFLYVLIYYVWRHLFLHAAHMILCKIQGVSIRQTSPQFFFCDT